MLRVRRTFYACLFVALSHHYLRHLIVLLGYLDVLKHTTFSFINNFFVGLMNYFCGMVDPRKAFSLISRWGLCQRSSPSEISDMPCAGLEPAQNLTSGFVE